MEDSTQMGAKFNSADRSESLMPAQQANHVALRSRWRLLVFSVLVLALGWSARAYAPSLPSLVGSYAPDTLWALLVFLVVLLLRPALPIHRALLVALLLSYSIELSQLYQAPWLNQIRDTRAGGLLLGHGFLWSDLVCYTVGIALGATIDACFKRRKSQSTLD